MKIYYVYILACSDKSYYVGITSNLSYRMFQHQSGFYPDSYTSKRRPVILKYYAEFTDVGLAINYEKQLKRWSRKKKQALINGNYDKLPNLAKKKFRSRYNSPSNDHST